MDHFEESVAKSQGDAGEEVTEREGGRKAGGGVLSVAFMVKREVNA